MHAPESPGIPGEVFEWIGAGLEGPVQVHLEIDERRIGLAEQHIIGTGAGDGWKLEVVIVVGKAQAVAGGTSPNFIEPLRQRFPIVDGG